MTDQAGMDLWSTGAWREDAIAWIDRALERAGIARTGRVEQPRVRPWATVLTVPTTEGRYWLKAAAPAAAFEVALYPLLHRLAPEAVLTPLATDIERGWLLLPDGGMHLSDIAEGEELVTAMEHALPRYAALQRAAAAEVDGMVAIGVADMRPAAMPDRFEEALELTGSFVARSGTAEHRSMWERSAAMRDTVQAWCEALAASAVSSSIDHNDLHPRNMLVGDGSRVGGVRFYDWGDSVVAHPFASLLVALRFMQAHLRVADDDPALLRLRDAYLEVFGNLGPRAELVKTVEVACRVARIARSLVWHRAISLQPEEEASEFADAPLYWLAEILQPSWLGSPVQF